MKKLLAIVGLVISQVVSVNAQLSLLYPQGGEDFPGNGMHIISWTNVANMGVTLYFDWYDTDNVVFVSDNALYTAVLPTGTNSFVLATPARYPSEYRYKVRLVGTNASTNITVSSGFVHVTGPATLSAHLDRYDPWLPGQSRTNTLVWSGFQSNDTCLLTFESPILHMGDYGFLVTNFTLMTPSGTHAFVMPYPAGLASAYPPASHTLLDGPHLFLLLNERCQIIQFTEEIDVVTTALRMSLAANNTFAIARGDSAICGSVVLDSTLATINVQVTNIAIILTSFSTNWLSLKFTLKDGNVGLRTNTLSYKPSSNSQYSTKVDFPINLIITNGQLKELPLWCEVLSDSETGSFLWTTDEISSTIQSGIGAIYINGAPISKTVMSSTTSFVDVVQVFQPKFFFQTQSSGVSTFQVVCKPQVSYTLQWSTNLTDWYNDFTTNSVTNVISVSMSTTNGTRFFRLKEN